MFLILIYVLFLLRSFIKVLFNGGAQNTQSAGKFNGALSKSVKNGRKISFLAITVQGGVVGLGRKSVLGVCETCFSNMYNVAICNALMSIC